MQVKGNKALKVSAECGESAEKVAKAAQTAQLAPRSFVHVHETKTLEDGTRRCCISTIAEQGTVLTAALNEFNHATQRFKNAAEYEASRVSYCNDIVEREALVEDAITGNLLRIKDQTLHVSTATDVQDNASVPPEWRVDDVRDLVHLLQRHVAVARDGEHDALCPLDWEVKQRRRDRCESGVSGTRLTKAAPDAHERRPSVRHHGAHLMREAISMQSDPMHIGEIDVDQPGLR